MGALLISDGVAASFGPQLDVAAPGRPRVVLAPGAPLDDPGSVEIAYFSHDLYPERAVEFVRAVAACPNLRWVHSMSAGVDHPFFRHLLGRGIRLTTSAGAHAVPIAHTVMLYLLALSRDLPGWLAAQGRRAWAPHPVRDLQGRTLGVVGLGPIGREVARLGEAFRMHVFGVRRTPRGDEPWETWPLARLDALLPRLDALVLALPLAPNTRHLLDARRLGLLRPDAVLVNVGRGELVDEVALAEALAAGRLGGAGLDVFASEPLPAESPLWTLPGVLVTPHSSGASPGNAARASLIFLDNLERYGRGAPLRNEVGAEPGGAALTGPQD